MKKKSPILWEHIVAVILIILSVFSLVKGGQIIFKYFYTGYPAIYVQLSGILSVLSLFFLILGKRTIGRILLAMGFVFLLIDFIYSTIFMMNGSFLL
jgi:hypothetical protein